MLNQPFRTFATAKNTTLKASDIKSNDIRGAMREIESKYKSFAEEVARKKGWAIGDAIEAIASFIVYKDEDYKI